MDHQNTYSNIFIMFSKHTRVNKDWISARVLKLGQNGTKSRLELEKIYIVMSAGTLSLFLKR